MAARAYCMTSGGLDSVLAIKVLQNQGIETVGVHFVSPFFDKSQLMEQIAKDMNIEMKVIDISKEHVEMMHNPKYGFGKNFNPCIDCHALMFRKAGELLDPNKEEFIATGEVLDQRPMSQNKRSLRSVEKHSGQKGMILRPLSAKLLEPTIPEEKGWVDREQLLAIVGKTRKKQYELAEKLGVPVYQSPAGGCILTEPFFAAKLKKVYEKGMMDHLELVRSMRFGRIMELSDRKYIIVARNAEQGNELKKFEADFHIEGNETAGPVIIGWGDFTDAEKAEAGKVFCIYSKVKGGARASYYLDGKETESEVIEDIDGFKEQVKKWIL